MLVIVSQVQRVEIECTRSEYRDARSKVESEDYKVLASGPKIEDGMMDKNVYVVVGEKITVRQVVT